MQISICYLVTVAQCQSLLGRIDLPDGGGGGDVVGFAMRLWP